jgi:ABC-type dipeptide/oligopeptide/nickel transport system ATPase subunit
MLALQAKDLVVGARIDGEMVPAIRALSFDLEPGKILGLVGESGAGKSMVGRAIAQLLPPGFEITSGSLLFEGEDLVRMAPGARRALLGRAIAFIPQAPMTSLNPVRTIGAQFDEHLARLGEGNRGGRRDRAVAMLTAARLPRAAELLTQYPHQLSGGMCQRVLIALAFSSNPRLVIADEPTTALDVTMHPPILALIADMQRAHGTAVIFFHPRPAACRATVRPGHRDVCRPRRRERAGARRALHAGASLYAVPAARQSVAARRAARALRHAGPDAEPAPAQKPARLSFRAALSAGYGGVPPRRAAEHGHRRRSPCRLHSRRGDADHRGDGRRWRCGACCRAIVAASRSFAKALYGRWRIVCRRAQCCGGEAGDIQHCGE